MQSTNGTHSDLADTLIGLTVGFLFCVLCMCALGYLVGCDKPEYACGKSIEQCEQAYWSQRSWTKHYMMEADACANATNWQAPPTPTRLPTPTL